MMRIVALCAVLVAAVAADGSSRYNPPPTYSSSPVQTYQPLPPPVYSRVGGSSQPAPYGGYGRRTVITPGRLVYNRYGIPVPNPSYGGGNRYEPPRYY